MCLIFFPYSIFFAVFCVISVDMPPSHVASKRPACLSPGSLIISLVLLVWLGSFGYFLYSREQPNIANNPASTPRQPEVNVNPIKPGVVNVQPKPAVTEIGENPIDSKWLPTYTGEKLHIVFSTDCSYFQDWQTLLVFHSAMVINQPGDVTRIASGCTEDRQKELLTLYKVLFPQYRVHFTPDYKKDGKTKKKYDFYNKPYGLHHWLLNAKLSVPEDTIIILIDPDMVLMRPITAQIRGNPINLYEKNFNPKTEKVPLRVQHSVAAASMYGLGAPWTLDNHQHQMNRTAICGEKSPCLKVTREFGEKHYSVGPPYLMHKGDMLRVTDKWTEFVPRVYEHYPELLAEMYAYSMAAAHAEVPHFTLVSYMVSNIEMTGDEGWEHVDALGGEVCKAMDLARQDVSKMQSGEFTGTYPSPEYIYPSVLLPHVLHYCQFYRVGEWGFQKRRFRKKMLTCDGPLMSSLSPTLASIRYKNRDGEIIKIGPKQASRGGFMLCTVHAAINRMLVYYKHKMCRDVGVQKMNFNMTENLVSDEYQ